MTSINTTTTGLPASTGIPVDPNTTVPGTPVYVDPNAAPQPTTSVAAPQTVTTSGPTPQDFANLGIFTAEELQQVAGMPAAELGPLYDNVLAYLNTAQGQADLQARVAAGVVTVPASPTTTSVPTAPTTSAPVAPTTGAGSVAGGPVAPVDWAAKFTTLFAAAGLSAEESAQLMQQLGAANPSDADLQSLYDSYVAQLGYDPSAGAGAVGAPTTTGPTGTVDPSRGDPGQQFTTLMKAAGLDDATQQALLAEFSKLPVDQQSQAIAYYATPEGQAELKTMAAEAGGGAGAPAAAGTPKELHKQFVELFTAAGIDEATQKTIFAQLDTMKPEEQAQAYAYYTTTPEGKAELDAIAQQAAKAKKMGTMMNLGMYGLVGLGAVGTTALAASKGNLARSLAQIAQHGTESEVAAATRVLSSMGTPDAERAIARLTRLGVNVAEAPLAGELAVARSEGAAALRALSGTTNRMLHPIAKMRLNAAARALGESTKLSFRDAMKFGLGMQFGDVAPKAAVAGVEALESGGAAAAAARAAGSEGLMAATRGGGAMMKVLGPVGIAAMGVMGAFSVKKSIEAEGGFGPESKKVAGEQGGMLAGAVGGAAAGAALGSVVPVIGTGVGAIAGGIIGSGLGGWVGKGIGGMFG